MKHLQHYATIIRIGGWFQILFVGLCMLALALALSGCIAPTMPTSVPVENTATSIDYSQEQADAQTPAKECAYVTALKTVNVRQEPSVNSAVIDYLEHSTVVQVDHSRDVGNWWFVLPYGYVD